MEIKNLDSNFKFKKQDFCFFCIPQNSSSLEEKGAKKKKVSINNEYFYAIMKFRKKELLVAYTITGETGRKETEKWYTSYSKFSEINLIRLGIVNPNLIRLMYKKILPNGKIIGRVENANTLHHKTLKPLKGGLFCEAIFGPVKDFSCACGKVGKLGRSALNAQQISGKNIKKKFAAIQLKTAKHKKESSINRRKYCPDCDVEYTWSVIRRYQLGYIGLGSPVTHVWYVKGNPSYISILLDMKKRQLEYITYGSEVLTLENSIKKGLGTDLPLTLNEIITTWKKTQNLENFKSRSIKENNFLSVSSLKTKLTKIDNKVIPISFKTNVNNLENSKDKKFAEKKQQQQQNINFFSSLKRQKKIDKWINQINKCKDGKVIQKVDWLNDHLTPNLTKNSYKLKNFSLVHLWQEKNSLLNRDGTANLSESSARPLAARSLEVKEDLLQKNIGSFRVHIKLFWKLLARKQKNILEKKKTLSKQLNNLLKKILFKRKIKLFEQNKLLKENFLLNKNYMQSDDVSAVKKIKLSKLHQNRSGDNLLKANYCVKQNQLFLEKIIFSRKIELAYETEESEKKKIIKRIKLLEKIKLSKCVGHKIKLSKKKKTLSKKKSAQLLEENSILSKEIRLFNKNQLLKQTKKNKLLKQNKLLTARSLPARSLPARSLPARSLLAEEEKVLFRKKKILKLLIQNQFATLEIKRKLKIETKFSILLQHKFLGLVSKAEKKNKLLAEYKIEKLKLLKPSKLLKIVEKNRVARQLKNFNKSQLFLKYAKYFFKKKLLSNIKNKALRPLYLLRKKELALKKKKSYDAQVLSLKKIKFLKKKSMVGAVVFRSVPLPEMAPKTKKFGDKTKQFIDQHISSQISLSRDLLGGGLPSRSLDKEIFAGRSLAAEEEDLWIKKIQVAYQLILKTNKIVLNKKKVDLQKKVLSLFQKKKKLSEIKQNNVTAHSMQSLSKVTKFPSEIKQFISDRPINFILKKKKLLKYNQLFLKLKKLILREKNCSLIVKREKLLNQSYLLKQSNLSKEIELSKKIDLLRELDYSVSLFNNNKLSNQIHGRNLCESIVKKLSKQIELLKISQQISSSRDLLGRKSLKSKKRKLLEKKELLVDHLVLRYNQIVLKKSELWIATSVLFEQEKNSKIISKNLYPVHNVKSFLKNVSIPFYLLSRFSYSSEIEESQKETKIKKRIKNKTKIKNLRLIKLNKNNITAKEIITNLEKKSKKAMKKIYTNLITNLIKKNCPLLSLELNDILKQKQLIKKTRLSLAELTIKNKIKKTKLVRNQILKKTYKMILNKIIYKKNLIFWKLIQTTTKNKFFTKLLNIDTSKIVFMPDYRYAIATQAVNQNCGTNLFKSCTLSPMQLFYLGFKNLRVLRKINSNISLKKEFDFIKKEQSNLMVEKEFLLGCFTNTNQFNRPFLIAKPLKKDTEAKQLNFLLAKNCHRLETYSFFHYFCSARLRPDLFPDLLIPTEIKRSAELSERSGVKRSGQNKKLIDYSPQSLSLLHNNKSINLKKSKLNYLVSRWIISCCDKNKILNKFAKKLPDKIIQFFLTAILRNKIYSNSTSRSFYFFRDKQQQQGFATQSIGQVANKKKLLKQNTVDILSKNKISKVNFLNLKTNHLKNELNFKKKKFLPEIISGKMTLERKKTIIYFLKKIIFLTFKNQTIINYNDSIITSRLKTAVDFDTFNLNKNKSISQPLNFNLINFYTNFFKVLDYEGHSCFTSDLIIKNYAPRVPFFNSLSRDLAIKKGQLKKLIKKNSFDFLLTLNFGLLLYLSFKKKLKMFLLDPSYFSNENSKYFKEKKQLFAFSSLIKKFNKKRGIYSSSQISGSKKALGRGLAVNPFTAGEQTPQKKIINTIYTLSYREHWETDQDWNIFRLYNIPCINFLDTVNPFYEETSWHSNKDYISFSKLSFQPLITSNYFPIYQKINNYISSWKKENLIKKDSLNTILEKYLITARSLDRDEEQNFQYNHRTAVFSGPGLINNLLREFNFDELTKMDLQNRFILFILNRKIVTLKNNFSKCYDSKDEKLVFKELKELYKKRELLIRRTKLVRQFNKNVSNPTLMMIHLLPVLPPDLRPIIKIGNQIAASDLNRLYQRVIYRNDRLKKFLIDSPTSSSYEIKYVQRLLQEAVDNLISNGKSGVTPEKDSRGRLLKSLSDTLKGKQGRFRQYLLGKRIDYSGRSVIVVGPTLKIHECGIPKEMAFELYLPFLLKNILNQKLTRTVIGAKTLIKKNPTLAWEVLKELILTSPVLLNRAPTLHRLGIQAFQPKLVEGRAILLHPLVCSAFNADFDGDQMAVHIPITVEARAEAWKLMLSRNNLLAPSTGEPLAIPSQDMVLGCYYLTTNCSDKNIQYQKGSGSYFLTFLDVIKNYENKKLDLHSIIWLKWRDWIENGNDHEEPLEIRINSYGDFKEIYAKSQNHYDKKKILINQYVSTTPGKVIFNQMIRKSLNLF